MPRDLFHIRDRGNFIRDEEGMELADLHAARLEATVSAHAMLADAIADADNIAHQMIELSDRSGRVLVELALRELVL